MNNDNDLNLHSMTKLSGWLRYWKGWQDEIALVPTKFQTKGPSLVTSNCVNILSGSDRSHIPSGLPH